MPKRNLKPFQKFIDDNAAWATMGGLRAQRHNSKPRKDSKGKPLPVNGFAEAFVEIGGRVLIDEDKYFEIVDKQNRQDAA